MDLLHNKELTEKIFECYNDRHRYELSKYSLMKLQETNEYLLIMIEQVLNMSPYELKNEWEKQW